MNIPNIIGRIVQSMRTTGEITVIGGVVSNEPNCTYTLCDPCTKVEDLSDGTYSYSLNAPYYYIGTKAEVSKHLLLKDTGVNTKFEKYPAIILQFDYTKVYENNNTGSGDVSLTIIICNNTRPEWAYSKRFDENFEPILFPLEESFIKACKKSNEVMTFDNIRSEVMPFIGENGKKELIANDFWDAIILEIDFKLIENCKKIEICQIT